MDALTPIAFVVMCVFVLLSVFFVYLNFCVFAHACARVHVCDSVCICVWACVYSNASTHVCINCVSSQILYNVFHYICYRSWVVLMRHNLKPLKNQQHK